MTVPLNVESSRLSFSYHHFAFRTCIIEGDFILEQRFHAQLKGRVVEKIVKADYAYPLKHHSLGSIKGSALGLRLLNELLYLISVFVW